MTRRANPIERADIAVAEAVAPLGETAPMKALGAASEVADQPPLIRLSIVVLALGLMTRRGRLARAGGRMLAAHTLATRMRGTIKREIDRTRPHLLIDHDHYDMKAGDSAESAQSSFPSGHTAGAVAVAAALGREYPGLVATGRVLSGAIAAIQVPRGKHYPSDLAVGGAIGWVAEASIDFVVRSLGHARRVRRARRDRAAAARVPTRGRRR